MKQNDITSNLSEVPVVILNGFLGSGKTTLMRNLLIQGHKAGLNVSVIVNDMSELDVDGEIIADTDIVGRKMNNFATISSDSLSSKSGIKKLNQSLEHLINQGSPDLIIIETSGSSHPLPLVEFFKTYRRAKLLGILVLADSQMLEQDYHSAGELISELQENLRVGRRDTVNLLVEQIMFASHLLLTKSDRLAEGKLAEIANNIHPLNPHIGIAGVIQGNLPIEDVLALPGYDYHLVDKLINELKTELIETDLSAKPHNMATLVIKDERPLHPKRLWDACHQYLGEQVYRSKGYFWLPGRDKHALLWNQAAGGINLEVISSWRAGIVDDPNNGLTENEVTILREKVAAAGGRFGDRITHLTVIGEPEQVGAFTQALEACLLTEAEIARWQQGHIFEDPWPTKLVKITG